MKNNKSVTAVEWLVEELGINHLVISKNMPITNKIFQQAKEMEKEQMMQCYEDGYNRVAKLIEDAAKQNGLNLNL
jgi:DNA polymerase III delta subunit